MLPAEKLGVGLKRLVQAEASYLRFILSGVQRLVADYFIPNVIKAATGAVKMHLLKQVRQARSDVSFLMLSPASLL